MYIEPTSNIYLCSGVPLDPSYEHTIYFSTIQSAADYFLTKAVKTFNHQSYQRVRRGWLRIKANAEELAGVNYLAFNNGLLHGSVLAGKWWFAFVTDVVYINENTTEIEYQLDVMTSYIGRYELGECFVEREHSATDELFEHTVPENLETGPYERSLVKWWYSYDYRIVVMTSMVWDKTGYDPDTNPSGGTIIPAPVVKTNNVFSGLGIMVFDPNGTELFDFIQKLQTDTADGAKAIVAMYAIPKGIADQVQQISDPPYEHTVTFADEYSDMTINSYPVRNKKLNGYPYNFILVEDQNGNSQEYRFERFETLPNVEFKIRGVYGTPPEISIFPWEYDIASGGSIGGTQVAGRQSGLRITDFPQIAWSSDSFLAWLAQNRTRSIIQLMGGELGTVASAAKLVSDPSISGGVALAGSAASVTNTLINTGIAERLANSPHGQQGIGNLDMAVHQFGVYFWRVYCRPEYLEILDDYFDKYGYATKRVKVPNTHVRPHWTYTKTIGCTLVNSHVPAKDASEICRIFDKGITFWVNPAEVGQYYWANSPVAPSNEGGDNNGTTPEA